MIVRLCWSRGLIMRIEGMKVCGSLGPNFPERNSGLQAIVLARIAGIDRRNVADLDRQVACLLLIQEQPDAFDTSPVCRVPRTIRPL